MEQLIQTLLTMTATASVAAVCVMILRLPLKRAPRWITCALWLVVFLRMVCPAGLSLPVSLVPQAISNGASLERVLPPVQQAASSAAPEGAALEAERPDSGGSLRPRGAHGNPRRNRPCVARRPRRHLGCGRGRRPPLGRAFLHQAPAADRRRGPHREKISMRLTRLTPPLSAAFSDLGSICQSP